MIEKEPLDLGVESVYYDIAREHFVLFSADFLMEVSNTVTFELSQHVHIFDLLE